jgi:hypothetical protein
VTSVLTDLQSGHEFEPVTFTLEPDRVRAYLAATGDQLGLYDQQGLTPPLAIAAFALGALLEAVTQPEGTLHISENLTFSKPVPVGAEVDCRARLAQRSVRAGMVVSVLETEISLKGELALTARATVMSPGAAS